MTAIAYDIAGNHYPSQKALNAAVKNVVRSMPRDRRYYSPLLQGVVNMLHEEVKNAGQSSTGYFMLLSWREQQRRGLDTIRRYRGGDLMTSYFRPLERWHPVTVYPWKRPKTLGAFRHAVREKASALLPVPAPQDRCVVLGCNRYGYDLRYHHIAPTFKEMFEAVWPLFTKEERASKFGFNMFEYISLADCIPDTHPAIQRIRELHQDNDWAWLCEAHHKDVP